MHTPVEVLMPHGVKVTSVAAGSNDSYAVTSTNTVYAWGAGSSGQIGNGSGAIQYAPVPVTIPAGTQRFAVTTGYADGTFRPTAPITRGQMAIYLYRYAHGADYIPPCRLSPFPDVSDASPFWCAINWLRRAQPVGITGGYADGTFRPTAAVSRQSMAAYLNRYFTDFYGYGAE